MYTELWFIHTKYYINSLLFSYGKLDVCNFLGGLVKIIPFARNACSCLNWSIFVMRWRIFTFSMCVHLQMTGVLFYVSLALSCVPNAIFSPPCARPSVPIIFRWSPAFAGCLDPKPRHPPVGGSAVVASPRLDGSRIPAQIVSAVPYPAGWPFCCFYSLLVVVLGV